MNNKLIYVTLHTGSYLELQPVKPDSRTIHYEVKVNEHDQYKLEKLITKMNSKDVMQEHIFVRPFDELADDRDKETLKTDVSELFEMIYQLGTEETKKKMDEMRENN
ncbi:hypothetical protein [Salipaludibacillus daqingensis]|uniref:hypothetical protein n=1 Tax=Salipaludibacillus daqingensis TaxID=3041001 RepID=UPI002474B3FB|nr:hypothetical protein [Salipaludibacillus daqingensis]